MHYMRWQTHGTTSPDPSKTQPGEAQDFFETVVLTYTGDDCLIWPYSRVANGYGTMGVNGVHKIVSRLACEAVKRPSPATRVPGCAFLRQWARRMRQPATYAVGHQIGEHAG
jgi:hypothetical protein